MTFQSTLTHDRLVKQRRILQFPTFVRLFKIEHFYGTTALFQDRSCVRAARPFLPPAKKGPAHIAGPAYISSAKIYFAQVLLIIFTSVTLKLPIASVLDAFSTCPSFFSSTFVSGLAVPVTVT